MNNMHRINVRSNALLRFTVLATLGVGCATTVPAANDETPIKDKTAICAACHGADGNGVSVSFPRIAGQHSSYLAVALRAYRDGSRQNAIMNGVAKDLTDEAIDELAAYYGALPGKLSTLPQY